MQAFIYRMDKQQVLLYSTENDIQYPVINHNGKEYIKKRMCVCVCIYIYIYTHTHTYIYTYTQISESPCCTAETDSQTQTIDLWLSRGVGGEGMEWESGISRCKLLYIGWINNKVLLYSIGDSIQCTVINHRGKEYEKECIYVYN